MSFKNWKVNTLPSKNIQTEQNYVIYFSLVLREQEEKINQIFRTPEHGEKIHLCDFCGKGFIFEDSCKSHKRTQHQIPQSEKRRYAKLSNSNADPVCDICNLDCKSLDGLANHKLTHQDGDFKLCLYCDYR